METNTGEKVMKYIVDNLTAGKKVTVATQYKYTTYNKKHLPDIAYYFKVVKGSLYKRRGTNSWDCIAMPHCCLVSVKAH
jgi:hypothetical protein